MMTKPLDEPILRGRFRVMVMRVAQATRAGTKTVRRALEGKPIRWDYTAERIHEELLRRGLPGLSFPGIGRGGT